MCFLGNGQPLRRALNHNRYSNLAYVAILVHDETYTRGRELSYLAFRFVFRAGAAIRNVARSVQATSAESELQ